MGYSNFLFLKEELSLISVMLILLVYDLFGSQKSLKYFHPVACVLFLAHTLLNLFPAGTAEAFGGMYVCTPIGSIVKIMPGTISISCPRLELYPTHGSSWNSRPTPCPPISRTTVYPLFFASS